MKVHFRDLPAVALVRQFLAYVRHREKPIRLEKMRRSVEGKRDEPGSPVIGEALGHTHSNCFVARAVSGLVNNVDYGLSVLRDYCGHADSSLVVVQLLIPSGVVVFEAPVSWYLASMSWDIDLPLADLAQRLVDTRLRAERLRLGQQLQALEARVSRQGLPTKGFKDLRTALQATAPENPERVDRALVLLRKPKGVWRKRYLTVQTKPGSVF